MSCNRQTVAAAICGLVEKVTGEKVSQSDWHGLVAAAKADGYQTGRTRLHIHDTISSIRALGKSVDDDAAAEVALAEIGYTDEGRAGMSINAVDGKFPAYTQNMAAVVRYLTNEGVKGSLDKMRSVGKAAKFAPISDADIQKRISGGSSSLGPEYEAYEFTVTGPDIVVADIVYARSAREAKSTVNEWTVRFKGQTEFTSNVSKSGPDDSQ